MEVRTGFEPVTKDHEPSEIPFLYLTNYYLYFFPNGIKHTISVMEIFK